MTKTVTCILIAFAVIDKFVHCWEAHDNIWKAIKQRGYENDVPPLRRDMTAITVNISMALMSVIDLDEVNEMMISSWLPLITWTDERLSWNASDYSGISSIQLPAKVIWTPDIVIFNSLDDPNRSLFNTNFRVSLTSTGDVEWNTPGVARTTCGVNVKYFPFDYQLCYIHIESTSTCKEDQLLDFIKGNQTSNEELLKVVEDNELWKVLNISFENSEHMCASALRCYIFLHRKPVYYVLNVILPILVLSLVALLVFWLPAGSGEKVGLAVTVVLSFTVAQDTMGNIVPKTSESLPLLSIYVVASSIMSALSLVASVFVLRLKEYVSVPPPRWLRRASYCLAHFSCVSPPDDSLNTGTTDDSRLSPACSTHSNDIYKPVPTSDTNSGGGDSLHGNLTLNSTVLLTDPGQQAIVAEIRAMRRLVKVAVETAAKKKDEEERSDNIADEWELVARVFDRVLFFLFSSISVIMLFVFLFYILVENNQDSALKRLMEESVQQE